MEKLSVVFNRDLTYSSIYGANFPNPDAVCVPKGTVGRLLRYEHNNDYTSITVAVVTACQYRELRLPGEVVDIVPEEPQKIVTTFLFQSPYMVGDLRDLNGQVVTLLGTRKLHEHSNSELVYRVRFPDGTLAEVFDEELHPLKEA